MAATYEIRRSGQTLCTSSIPDMGYSPATLKDMARNGLHLYCDGKRKSRPGPATTGDGKGK